MNISTTYFEGQIIHDLLQQKMNTFTIVENIISPSSVSRLISGLSQIKNISNISVIPQLGKVSFRFEDRGIHLEVLKELEKLGFPPKAK